MCYKLRASALVFDSNDKRGISVDPAIEIVTFAVDTEYQDMWMTDDKSKGCISNYILSYIIDKYINHINKNYCAVKYIVLYALEDAVGFYEKNKFLSFNEYMVKPYDSYIRKCIPMYFNLLDYNGKLQETIFGIN